MKEKKHKKALVWLRRDLRLEDHAPLAHASSLAHSLAVAFVFDSNILKNLPEDDRRLTFLHRSLRELDEQLREKGSRLIVKIGDPAREIPSLAAKLGVGLVCVGRDHEPYAKKRDAAVARSLESLGIGFTQVKDQVIFGGLEVKNQSGAAFKVFTPYKNAWLKLLKKTDFEERMNAPFQWIPSSQMEDTHWEMRDIGFSATNLWLEAGAKAAQRRLQAFAKNIQGYHEQRNYPAVNGTSGLSVHLRFGTISPRQCLRFAMQRNSKGSETWINEIIWRDFYQMILDQNPHIVGHAFRKEYENIQWPGKASHFQAWCEGRTGFPLVDAAMRHFNQTGWMHNRLRMVVASFLTKDLLVDWRMGEAYFAQGLLDFDLAANNGGWQWSASTGCDAQPYFRIFNPYSQSEKFDPEGEFIRANVPELKNLRGKQIHQPETGGLFSNTYIPPIIDHGEQRMKALALFKKEKSDGKKN